MEKSGDFPEAFEAEDGDKNNEESITLYPTSTQRSGSLLEVTDHLGKFSKINMKFLLHAKLNFLIIFFFRNNKNFVTLEYHDM